MRRLLTALMVLGFTITACSGGDSFEPAADSEGATDPAVGGDVAPSEASAPGDSAPGEPADNANLPAAAEEPGDAAAALPAPGAEEMVLDELNVAYVSDWPTANQVARVDRTYDDVLDLTVNWVPFASSDAMTHAMEAGDIDIAYSQGLTPFARAVTGGSDLLLVGVAVSYLNAGIPVFDIISTPEDFAEEYPSVVTAFLQVTENINRAYNENREPFIDIIAAAAGMDRDATIALLDTFIFLERDVQLSEAWLGGAVQKVMKQQMDYLAAQGEIESALGSYDTFVDDSLLEAVN